jgi:hypothetical protein
MAMAVAVHFGSSSVAMDVAVHVGSVAMAADEQLVAKGLDE